MQLCVNAKISLLVNTVYIDMSTQTRNSGGGGRNQKKSNSSSGGGGGGDSITQASSKKTDLSKTEKEKSHPKPTAEQLRIAEITNSNKTEDPQMREKVATLIEMTQRSEEEVCCALNECDNNLERAVVFLLETLPVGAFETSSKKKKNKAANSAQDNAGGDGDWADGNANTDKREKSRNRNTSNRGGRGGTDSRGWRGREARENDRNSRGAGAERSNDDRNNDNYRSGPRPDGPRRGGIGSRGGGYVGRGGRGGGRMGGGGRGMGSRGERSGGGYSSRYNNNTNDDHREVELWDNTIAQNAEKQHQQSQDDAWGDWDNEEYVGSLKDSKVFTTSNLPNQTAASVLSSGLTGSGAAGSIGNELSAPPGLEHHLGTSVMGGTSATQSSHYNSLGVGNIDDTTSSSVTGLQSATTTPMMQYSAAVSSTPQMQQQSSAIGGNPLSAASALSGNSATLGASQYGSAVDTFTNAATAAANLVQQVQQQQQLTPQIKPPSTTLTAEQSQYFSSLTSQNTAAQQQQQQQQQLAASYAQNSASVQYPPSYANVFNASSPGSGATAGSTITNDPTAQLTNSQQPAAVRRARAKLPPPSKIPQSAVEMPGDSSLNNIGFLDVQFGGLDFGNDDSFENISEKYNNSVNLVDSQQQQQVQQQQQQTQQKSSSQLGQSPQDVVSSYEQNKSVVQQQQSALTSGLQNTHLADTLSAAAAYSQRSANQQQQQSQQQAQQLSNSVVAGGNNALDQLTKNDPYSQTNNASASAYQSSYQTSANVTNKAATNAYQASVPSQGYGSSSYGNVQSSVANSYQPQSYGSYQQNSMNSYQQQQQQSATGTQGSSNVSNTVVGGGNTNSTQNIPSVGGSNSTGNASASANSSYLSSAYGSQQNAYQPNQSVYGSAGLSNNTGYSGSTSTSSSQYSNFSTTAKLKDTSAASNTSHYESVSSSNVISNSGSAVNSATSGVNSQNAVSSNTSNNSGGGVGVGGSNNSHTGSNSTGVAGVINNSSASNVISQSVSGGGVNSSSANNTGNNSGTSVTGGSGAGGNSASSAAAAAAVAAAAAAAASGVSSSTNKTGGVSGSGVAPTGAGSTGASSGGTGSGSGTGGTGGSGMVPPNIQMVSQYIQTSMPYHYQHPVYSYEDLQMMQQRVPHVQGYYDLNYTSPSLGAGRDNLGSVAYSTMTDGRFARTDNNSSPVSNVSSTMSQQASSGGPMLNVPYAYFYGGNVMPGSFQYGTPAIYPQIPAANTASGGQFPKPSYNTGYGSTNYDALTQASQDYTKGSYPSSVTQQTKSQNVTNPPQAGAGSDITSSMYSKGHVALNKVNSYEKQNFHSGTPPPFNMANTQTAGGTSAQPYGMYLPTMPAAGHHMIHPPMHQMDGRIHSSSRDSNSTGQRQPTSSQSKSATKQGYSPSYWTGQN